MSNANEYFIKVAIMKNIKDFRTTNNISQQTIAKILGIERSTYSSWETGRSTPNTAQLIMLAQIYNVSVEKMVSDNAPFALSSGKGTFFSDTYLSALNEEEKEVILKYRLLNEETKDKINELLNKQQNGHLQE